MPEQLQELAAFPPAVRELIDAELAIGNPLIEIGHSFPAPPAGAYVRFGKKVSTRPRESDDRLDFRSRYSSISSGEWTDAQRFYFVVEPPDEEPQDPFYKAPSEQPQPSPAAGKSSAPRPTKADLPPFVSPPATRSSIPPLSAIPIRIAMRDHRQPPQTSAYSGPLEVRELPTGVEYEVSLRDDRTPIEMRALLERILDAPFTCNAADARLNATTLFDGARFDFSLVFVVAAERINEYLFTMNGSWTDIPAKNHEYYRDRADGWFELWTRVWPPAQWSRPPRHIADLHRERLAEVLAEDMRLASVHAIQQTIISGMKRGGSYSASDKEGTSRISWNGMRFVRSGEGDHLPYASYADEPEFLAALLRFCDVASLRSLGKSQLSEREAWLLVLRQMNEPA